jgi:hypothetical protein
MNKYIIILFAFIGSFANAQGYDFQALCLECAEQNGFYCGDDPANWTQYSPNGCVPNGLQDLFYLNDGWEDCADGSDEDNAEPTSPDECLPPDPFECDTVFVTLTELEFIFDTIVETEYVYNIVLDTVEIETFVPEYIYITDTVFVYEDVLDTLFVDVIEYVDVIVYDTVVEIEYVEFIEYITEYIDCDTGYPCEVGIDELLDKSKQNDVIYNINGQAIEVRQGLYIENGKIKYTK